MTSASFPEMPRSVALTEREIIDFLRANPAFLDRHPQLLGQLSITHASGDAVSLLERQVAVLREDNTRLKKQLDDLLGHARQNEQLTNKIQALVLTLMNAVGPQAIFASLERCLRADFGADHVVSLIFAESAAIDGSGVGQFIGANAGERAAFAQVLASAGSSCGALNAAQRLALFGVAAFDGSAVVMPLIARGWDGVVVIASNEAERYQAHMGTEFLNYLREIVALVIDPWVKRAKRA